MAAQVNCGCALAAQAAWPAKAGLHWRCMYARVGGSRSAAGRWTALQPKSSAAAAAARCGRGVKCALAAGRIRHAARCAFLVGKSSLHSSMLQSPIIYGCLWGRGWCETSLQGKSAGSHQFWARFWRRLPVRHRRPAGRRWSNSPSTVKYRSGARAVCGAPPIYYEDLCD